MLFGTWAWQKLRSLNRRNFAKPIVVLFIASFFASHLMYIWADANFYRPITMQRANLPLSYPMTARKFLEKHGLLNAEEYQKRLIEQGNPEALAVEYPLNSISFAKTGSKYNLLMIVVDGVHTATLDKDMPALSDFANHNIRFDQHFSSGNRNDTGQFGLFYGISPSYMQGILAARKPSALVTSLEQQGYEFGLFASDGFNSPLYRQALLTDFTLPPPVKQSDGQTVSQWQQWLNVRGNGPWFSYVNLNGISAALRQDSESVPTGNTFIHRYQAGALSVDDQIKSILQSLKDRGELDKTVVVITASHGIEFNENGTWGSGNAMNRRQLQVPLIIHWPGTPAQSINKLTDHADVMTTLMQRLLHVTTSPADYSQGEDLFAAKRRHNWVTTSDDGTLIITTPDQTLELESNGDYRAFDTDGKRIKDQKPELGLLLQVLTDEKRFLAN